MVFSVRVDRGNSDHWAITMEGPTRQWKSVILSPLWEIDSSKVVGRQGESQTEVPCQVRSFLSIWFCQNPSTKTASFHVSPFCAIFHGICEWRPFWGVTKSYDFHRLYMNRCKIYGANFLLSYQRSVLWINVQEKELRLFYINLFIAVPNCTGKMSPSMYSRSQAS